MKFLRQLICRLWRDHENLGTCYTVGNRDLAKCPDCGYVVDLGKHFAHIPSDQ